MCLLQSVTRWKTITEGEVNEALRAILSRLLTKYEASRNAKAVALITQISPAAWRHILLNGHYTFQSGGKMIDLDTLLAGLELG